MKGIRFLVAALSSLAALPLHAQAMRGRVVDAAGGAGVPQATVTATAERRPDVRVLTAADGTFEIAFRQPGVYTVRVERTGYQAVASRPVTVGPTETVEVEVRVAAQAVTLDPLTVTARRGAPRVGSLERAGFYDREARGLGRFLRRDVIEKRQHRRLANILDELPGIHAVRDRNGNEFVTVTRAQSTGAIRRAQRGEDNICPPQIYLDGTLVHAGTPGSRQSGTGINDLISPERIEAIEVYGSTAQLPVEYSGSNAACGVVLIWSRAER
jgi:hypothetical protein